MQLLQWLAVLAALWLVLSVELTEKGTEQISLWFRPKRQRLNLQNKTLTIASVMTLPFQNVTKLSSGKYTGEGFSFEIVNHLSWHFNFNYEIIVPPDGEYGKLINNTHWTGLIGTLINKKADMAAATITVTRERQKVVRFSGNLYKDTMGMLLQRPNTGDNSGALLAPFNTQVWMLVIGTSVLMCPTIYLFVKYHRCLLGSKFKGKMQRCYTFGDCLWFVYAGLMKQGAELSSSYNSVRILMAAWWITSLIITAFYSANLTAYLTLENIRLGNTLESLLDSGVKWMFVQGTALEDALMQDKNLDDTNSLSLLKNSLSRGKGLMVESDDEAKIKLYQDYAFLEETTVLNHIVRKDYQKNKGRCEFTVRDLQFFEHYAAFAFPPDSPYASHFTTYIETLKKSGLILKWMQEYMPTMAVCDVVQDHKLTLSEHPLSLKEIYSAFYILLLGLSTGLATLIVEKLWGICKRTKPIVQRRHPIYPSHKIPVETVYRKRHRW